MKKIAKFNKALMFKWIWRILQGNESLWLNVLRAKYSCMDFHSIWTNMAKDRGFGSIWWKDIMKFDRDLFDCCSFKVGDGG